MALLGARYSPETSLLLGGVGRFLALDGLTLGLGEAHKRPDRLFLAIAGAKPSQTDTSPRHGEKIARTANVKALACS